MLVTSGERQEQETTKILKLDVSQSLKQLAETSENYFLCHEAWKAEYHLHWLCFFTHRGKQLAWLCLRKHNQPTSTSKTLINTLYRCSFVSFVKKEIQFTILFFLYLLILCVCNSCLHHEGGKQIILIILPTGAWLLWKPRKVRHDENTGKSKWRENKFMTKNANIYEKNLKMIR